MISQLPKLKFLPVHSFLILANQSIVFFYYLYIHNLILHDVKFIILFYFAQFILFCIRDYYTFVNFLLVIMLI